MTLLKTRKKTLAINLLYNPTGGSLAQIKKLLENIDKYEFTDFIIYIIPSNIGLIKNLVSQNIRIRSSKFAGISLITRTIWEQFFLPLYLILDRVNILFCPGNIAPIFSLSKKAQWIGTIGPFDEDFVRIYAQYSFIKRFILFFNKILMLYSSKTSNHVFFESFYTRDMFMERYGFDEKKTSVLQIGKDEYFKPEKLVKSGEYSNLLRKKFILSVSHLYPYKNIETLLHAYSQLRSEERGLSLVLAGSTQNVKYFNKLKDIVASYGLEDSIYFVGNLEPSDLRQFYSHCYTLIFTSPFENFAYTLVEAMSCGVPIISSNTTAMPETCRDSALYFNPYSADDLVNKAELLLSDEELRKKLISNSLARANELETYDMINIKTNQILQSIL